MKEFIIMNYNGKEITKRINSKYNYDINYMTIANILFYIRKTIAGYLKHTYPTKQICGDLSIHIIVAMYECLFLHILT